MTALQRRVFDLVLFNENDADMVPLRISELSDVVDVMVFAETEYSHGTGRRKALSFNRSWLDEAPFAYYRPILGFDNISRECTEEAILNNPQQLKNRRKRTGKNWAARCRESYSRNELGRFYDELGGGSDDWAMISDADEVPRAKAVSLLRKTIIAKTKPVDSVFYPGWMQNRSWSGIRIRLINLLPVVSFGAIHHFKYTLGCERRWIRPGATWLKGPVAIHGSLLRYTGTQAARTLDGCFWAGYRHSCGPALVHRVFANASWHMSSLSGGVLGHLRKMRDNAATAYYTAEQKRPAFVIARADKCLHGETTAMSEQQQRARRQGFATHYERTPWGPGRPLPQYPDVPKYVMMALYHGHLQHFLSWNSSSNRISTVGFGEIIYNAQPTQLAGFVSEKTVRTT